MKKKLKTYSPENPLDVTVKRSKWYRGQGDPCSRLLLDDSTLDEAVGVEDYKEVKKHLGKMCCLGFACLAAGLTKRQIGNVGCPSGLLEVNPFPLMRFTRTEDPARYYVEDAIIGTNDSENSEMTDAAREERLTRLGKLVGINFTFVD